MCNPSSDSTRASSCNKVLLLDKPSLPSSPYLLFSPEAPASLPPLGTAGPKSWLASMGRALTGVSLPPMQDWEMPQVTGGHPLPSRVDSSTLTFPLSWYLGSVGYTCQEVVARILKNRQEILRWGCGELAPSCQGDPLRETCLFGDSETRCTILLCVCHRNLAPESEPMIQDSRTFSESTPFST